jgi:hypothetical protein
MYERRTHHLLALPAFRRRALRHLSLGVLILLSVVAGGTFGYHRFGQLPWIDAFLNASMILSGMGPVDRMGTAPAKIFSALYALFSGLVFIGVMGLVLAPWAHRLMHWIHVESSAR